MNSKNFSILIVAGGKSSRIGTDKRFIKVGGVSMLEITLKKAAKLNPNQILLCAEKNLPQIQILAQKFGATVIIDEFKDAGALSGIANGLKHSKTAWNFAVSADMPFFDFKILNSLTDFDSAQAIIPICDKKQMLSAFYHKNLAEIFYNELLSGQRKIFAAIQKIPHKLVEIPCEEIFFNVNTRADLILARGRAENLKKTPIISIVAPSSGTGKTTFIEKIIRELKNIKIGVVKSTHHKILSEKTSSDSSRFFKAGAEKVYVGENFFEEIDKMTGVDLILTESRTKNLFPTIFLWRGNGEIKNEKIAAIFSSEPQKSDDIYQFDINDTDSAVKIVKFLAGYSILQISRPQFSH